MTTDCPTGCKLEGRVGRLEERVNTHQKILAGPEGKPERSLVFMMADTQARLSRVEKILWFIAAMIAAAVVTAILKSSGIGP